MSTAPSPSRRALVGTFRGTVAVTAAIGKPLEASSGTVPAEVVSFVVHLPAKPEAREQMRKMLFEVVDAMAREPDFVNTSVHETLDEPNTLVLYETWACSREYFIRHHLGKPYRLVRANYTKYQQSAAMTDYRAFPSRDHFLIASQGWEEIADYAIIWSTSHLRAVDRPKSAAANALAL